MSVVRTVAGRKPCHHAERAGKPPAHRRIRGDDGWLHTVVPAPRKGNLPI